LARLGRLTFRQSYAGIIPPPDLVDYTSRAFHVDLVRSELTEPTIIYLLAARGDNIWAYAKLHPTPPPPKIKAACPVELMRLYVLSDKAGKGILAGKYPSYQVLP